MKNERRATSNEQRFNQQGITLAVALICLFILLIIAMSINSIGIFNLRSVSNYRDSMIAYYAARAGVARAVDALKTNSSWKVGFDKVPLEDNDKATYEVTFNKQTPEQQAGKYDSTNNVNGSAPSRTDGINVPRDYAYIVSTGRYPKNGYNEKIRRVGAMVRVGSAYAFFGYNSLGVGGNSNIYGNVGTNASEITVNPGSTIDGSKTTNAGKTPVPVTDPLAASPLIIADPIETTQTLSPGRYTSIELSSSDTVTLSAGSYSFTGISITSNASINISSGPVYIYVNGDLTLTGQSVINTSHNAAQCIFYGTSLCTTINMRGGANAYYGIYAPYASIDFRGTSNVYGAIIGNNVSAGGTASIVYAGPDMFNLIGDESSGCADIITWQNVY